MKFKSKIWLTAALACSLLLAGCGTDTASTPRDTGSSVTANGSATENAVMAVDEPVSQEVFAMDTYMTVTAYGEHAQEAVDDAVAEIERLDALLSIGEADSEISKLNATGAATLSEDTSVMIDKALELYDSTGGAFDITVLPLMEAWGFTTEEYQVPSDDILAEILTHVGADQLDWDADSRTITLGNSQKIDLGGIAKGFTSGRIMEIFQKDGVTSGMVSLGGNVHLLGSKTDGSKWRVGIQDPDNTEDILGILEVEDCAVITSGGYERYFEQDGVTYHHIVDPKTGKPADSGVTSATIVSKDGTLADGLSTSLFIMGVDEAAAYWKQHAEEFDAVLATEDGTVHVTEGIADSFTCDADVTVITKD
ncbi:MAG: FAD:protein FMN transferase [Eubacteriales bacterium]|nr:FAD:protein FMN transferase [Eubacteriales bacterium]